MIPRRNKKKKGGGRERPAVQEVELVFSYFEKPRYPKALGICKNSKSARCDIPHCYHPPLQRRGLPREKISENLDQNVRFFLLTVPF